MSKRAAADFLQRLRADANRQAKLGSDPSPARFCAEGRRRGLRFSERDLAGVVDAEKFFLEASRQPALYERMQAAVDDRALAEIASELGVAVEAEDLEAVRQAAVGAANGPDLERVVGGLGPPAPFVPIPYPNIGYGGRSSGAGTSTFRKS